ncbi:TPA: hypothetical protein NHK58_001403 [Pseudomonas aeruginosa]|nr:hypothetical protein [Pseudomonas aeruginosa]
MAFISDYVDKKLDGKARPIVNITKYISFFTYRPYLNPETPKETYYAIAMFNFGWKYYEKFEYFIQNRITHDLVHNFIIDADLNEQLNNLVEFFDKTRDRYSVDFKDYELDRLRTVLSIIEEQNINIHKVVKLNSTKLAKVAINDYKYFNAKNKKGNEWTKSKAIIFLISILIVVAYYFIANVFNLI